MPRTEDAITKVARELCRKFPLSGSMTLARKLYKEHPTSFTTLDSARTKIRKIRGKSGEEARVLVKDKSQFEIIKRSTTDFVLPESHAETFEPYIIDQSKTLIISDLHFPYQDNNAIELSLRYGIKKEVTCILINGDLFDFATISRHEKDWRHRTVANEFEAVRVFLTTLRTIFPNAKIVYKLGNHDERWEKWLFIKAPEIFDDPEFRLETRLKLGELGIDIVKDKRPVKVGKLTVLHGHELVGAGGVNPARATFTKTLSSVLVGHYHRTSQHTEPTMDRDVINVNSTGCLCGMTPLWMPINKWNLGFAYVELDIKTGEYELSNLKIVNGKIYQ